MFRLTELERSVQGSLHSGGVRSCGGGAFTYAGSGPGETSIGAVAPFMRSMSRQQAAERLGSVGMGRMSGCARVLTDDDESAEELGGFKMNASWALAAILASEAGG